MTQDEIIEMGKQAGYILDKEWAIRFANLVAAKEREACAKMCDDLDDDLPDGLAGWQYGEAIRARGET